MWCVDDLILDSHVDQGLVLLRTPGNGIKRIAKLHLDRPSYRISNTAHRASDSALIIARRC